MSSGDSQVPWTDEQWALVRQAVQKEANRSRVAATFLPLFGPLAGDADFVKSEELKYIDSPLPPSRAGAPDAVVESETMSVDEQKTIPLTTLQVRVILHGAQMADPKLTSALEMFRRGSNVLARLEDAIVFRGQQGKDKGPPDEAISGLKKIWTVRGGLDSGGLFGNIETKLAKRAARAENTDAAKKAEAVDSSGQHLVRQVSEKIGKLEGNGHFGPFAVVLGQTLFTDAETASAALILPSDRIIPLLGGGPLLRSSTLPHDQGIVVALGAAPVELVVATDVSVGFLQVTTDPLFVFRVFEKIALRIKESDAIERLEHGAPVAK
jgi:uncharacterized linocin/CFP29 family protein